MAPQPFQQMRRILQIGALVVVVAALGAWLATGVNRGWTKTSVPVTIVDEVTGIEGREYRNRFVPGVDFLGLSLLGAALLAGLSFVFKPTILVQSPTIKPESP